MTREKMQDWLKENMLLPESTCQIIAAHVNHYYIEPASQQCEEKDRRIEELEDGMRAIINESGKDSFAGTRATQLLTDK